MTCPSCGRATVAPGRFCAYCGAPFVDHEAPTMAQAGGGVTARSVPSAPPARSRLAPADRTKAASHRARCWPIGTGLRVCSVAAAWAEVYRADDLVLGQPVALKFLPDAIAARPDRIARFRAEVRVAREVSHPNVCRVYDIGEIQGHPFLSMEWLKE